MLVPKKLFEHFKKLSTYEQVILFWLYVYSEKESKIVSISIADISSSCNITKQTAIRYLKKLIGKKIIKKLLNKNKTNKEFLTNSYKILIDF